MEDIMAMLSTIRHRGPDDEGSHVAPGFAVGHVRLAIVDPTSAGAQPMSTPDGRFFLAYNGEIYNHMDFRPDLVAKGVRFRGHSDTETLLWLLTFYGQSVIPKLNGIFSFSFYDSHDETLLLARDHMGVKPLYYAEGSKGRLLFASEIKALLATGEVEPRMNVDDILELFMFHFISGEKTAFANVSELLPGHFVWYSDGLVKLEQYWDPIVAARNGSVVKGDLRGMLEVAVKRQLMSDVPLGLMCSGGIDSGLVTAFSATGEAPKVAFCFRDPNNDYDEFEYAKQVCEKYDVELRDVRILQDEIPELLFRATWHYDEPLPRPHYLAAYAVAKEARASGLKVLLSGEGADELFGGYPRHAAFAAEMAESGDLSPLVFADNRVAIPRIARFSSEIHFLNAFRSQCAEETDGLDLVNRQLLVDQKTFLQHLLQRSDRMGMATGIEVRVPFLDIQLVEYANSLEGSTKVAAGVTKMGLKKAAADLLPPSILSRPKQGFDMPTPRLLQRGPVARLLDDMLLSGSPRCGDLFDPKGIEGLVRDLRAGQTELWRVAWMLLTTEIWMNTFKVTT